MEETSQTLNCNEHDDALLPTYHATIKERLDKWITADGYTRQGLTIEELAATLVTNRTYLSSYIKMVYHVSFREWTCRTPHCLRQTTVGAASGTDGRRYIRGIGVSFAELFHEDIHEERRLSAVQMAKEGYRKWLRPKLRYPQFLLYQQT